MIERLKGRIERSTKRAEKYEALNAEVEAELTKAHQVMIDAAILLGKEPPAAYKPPKELSNAELRVMEKAERIAKRRKKAKQLYLRDSRYARAAHRLVMGGLCTKELAPRLVEIVVEGFKSVSQSSTE